MARKKSFGEGFSESFTPTFQSATLAALHQILTNPPDKVALDREQQQGAIDAQKTQSGLIKAETALKQRDLTNNPNMYTHDQAAFVASPSQDPADIAKTKTALQTLWPNGVPKDAAHQVASSGRNAFSLGEKQSQFDDKQLQEFAKRANPLNAQRGGMLNLAGQINARIDKDIQTLNSPVVTNQMVNGVTSSIAGILKNGTPDAQGEAQQRYGTLWGDLMAKKQYITGTPADAVPQPVKDLLMQRLRAMKEVNNNLISDNFDTTVSSFPSLQAKHPEWIDNVKNKVFKSVQLKSGDQTTTQAKPDVQTFIQSLIKQGITDRNAIKQQLQASGY